MDQELIEHWLEAQEHERLNRYELEAIFRERGWPLRGSSLVAEGNVIWTLGFGVALASTLTRKRGTRPLIHLTLPNRDNILALRKIRDVCEAKGFQVIWAASNAMQAADFDFGEEVVVVDTRKSKHPWRADEQLIKANVRRSDWARDSWGRTSRNHRSEPAYFLSGYDSNEEGLSYFLCELPPGAEPTTVKEAYETLKPESVKVAEEQGLKVKRQGDMFFIRMKGMKAEPSGSNTYLHGSNHRADEYLIDSNELLYVRGTIEHRPEGRSPDHKDLRLGDHWWLCVRNTVPVVAR